MERSKKGSKDSSRKKSKKSSEDGSDPDSNSSSSSSSNSNNSKQESVQEKKGNKKKMKRELSDSDGDRFILGDLRFKQYRRDTEVLADIPKQPQFAKPPMFYGSKDSKPSYR